MSDRQSRTTNANRRTFLKLSATTAGSLILPSTVSGKSKPRAVGLKGNHDRPVDRGRIEDARSEILGGVSAQSSSDLAFVADDPVPEDGYLAGYALTIKNGAPVEMIQTVSEPQPIEKIRGTTGKRPGQKEPRRAVEAQEQSPPGLSKREFRNRRESRAHRSVEQFLAEKGGE